MNIMAAFRDLTDSEIDDFRENGWVFVPSLIAPEIAQDLFERASARMGKEAEISTGGGGGDPAFAEYRNILRNYLGIWKVEPLMAELSHSVDLARNVSRLLRGQAVRFFNDEVLVKPPIECGGRATPWHQDFPHAAFDRTGLVNVWISLGNLPEGGGAMSFLSGSQRHGPLGRTLLDDTDVLAQNPWLLDECPVASPPEMRPGDATIHGDLTIHGGPAFDGPHWRWAYLINLMDATIRYSGGPFYGEPVEGIAANETYPDDRYPVLHGQA